MKQQATLTSTQAKFLQVFTVLVTNIQEMSLHVPLSIQCKGKNIEMKGLINCGAERNFVDKDFATRNRIPIF